MEQSEHQETRRRMVSLAYRMLGSVSEAEDIVQEAFLRLHRAADSGTEIGSEQAYLATTTTRLAIDHLRSARVRRERYVGPWLPEPLVVDTAPDAAEHAETADTLSLALLVVLETLSPAERAVFLLADVFDHSFAEVADILGRSEASCRQLAVRARRRLEERRPRFDVSRERRDELARRFFAAFEEGETEALTELLAADAVFVGDGGASGRGVPRPVHGRAKVGAMVAGFGRQAARYGVRLQRAIVNGQPGAVVRDAEGGVAGVFALDIADGQIQAIRSVVNPDKLRHLGPPSKLAEELARARGAAAGTPGP